MYIYLFLPLKFLLCTECLSATLFQVAKVVTYWMLGYQQLPNIFTAFLILLLDIQMCIILFYFCIYLYFVVLYSNKVWLVCM